jgi:hypothetical protein
MYIKEALLGGKSALTGMLYQSSAFEYAYQLRAAGTT